VVVSVVEVSMATVVVVFIPITIFYKLPSIDFHFTARVAPNLGKLGREKEGKWHMMRWGLEGC